MFALSDKYLINVLSGDAFSPQNSTTLDVPWRQQPQNLLSGFDPHNPSHISLLFNNERKQNFLLCMYNLPNIPSFQCRDAGKGVLLFSIQAAPASSPVFRVFPGIPLPLPPSALPFPFYSHLWLCSVLWAGARLVKMLFQALLFHLSIRTGNISVPPAIILDGSHRFCPLRPETFWSENGDIPSSGEPNPFPHIFPSNKNKVCLTLRTSPRHKSFFQGF